MPVKSKPEAAERHRESSAVTFLSEWVRQGTESFFATQRILLDLVMRQNSNAISAVRERLSGSASAPGAALTEMAGEGLSNSIAAQRVVLQLAQRQNEIILGGVSERAGGVAPAVAMAELVRRGVDTFIDMQQHFLTIAAKQTDVWVDAAKEGRPFDGQHMAELARDAMENFVRSQKKFLDVVAEESAHATGAKNGKEHDRKSAQLAELAREGVEAFIDAQKKLLDIASQQVLVQVKVARRTFETMNPFPPVSLADLTHNTVESFVAAQKALLNVMAKPNHEADNHKAETHKAAPHKAETHKPAAAARKRPARRPEPVTA